jgi:type I restriction enzyme M protein
VEGENNMKLQDILKNTSFEEISFNKTEKTAIEKAIVMKQSKGANVPHIQCLIRKKEVKAYPEEIIRQL